jgi:RNA polymerase sigma factor (sigma-70 family)
VTMTELGHDAQVIGDSLHCPERFAEIYRRHATQLHRYAARRLGTEVADDVVANVFVAAFRVRRRYDLSRADARPWLFGILTREISRHRREELRRYRLLAALPAPVPEDDLADRAVERAAADGLRATLARSLLGLKPADRHALLLVVWADLSYAEAAAALGVPIGTVRSRLHRARRQVRAALSEVDHTMWRTD